MNLTIYFRKDVWENFSQEKNKSELVNELLEKHYTSESDKQKVEKSPDEGEIPSSSTKWSGPIYRNKKKGKL